LYISLHDDDLTLYFTSCFLDHLYWWCHWFTVDVIHE